MDRVLKGPTLVKDPTLRDQKDLVIQHVAPVSPVYPVGTELLDVMVETVPLEVLGNKVRKVPPGSTGAPGPQGKPGAKGDPGEATTGRNWKECSWKNVNSDLDNGLVKVCI